MIVSEGNIDNLSTIIIEGIGTFLFLSPDENGKLIDEDFSFMMTDEEYEVCDDKKVDFLLFEFGTKFYYSHLISSTNKYNEPIYKPEFLDFKYLGKCSEPFVMDFTHLGCHTEYEMLSGSGGCDLWCKKAKFLGHKAIGVCDKDSLASSLAFQTYAEKVGLKPIIGETITVARNYDEDEDLQETFELKLFVLNAEGWHNLLLISKTLHVDYDGYIPDTELYQYGRGLCCVIPKNSDFNDQVRHGGRKEADRLLKKYKKAFDKVYYQIDTVEYVSERLFKEHLQDIDNYVMYYRDKIEPLLINDAYYLDAEEKDLKPLLHKISGKAASEANDQYFKSVGDTIAAYSDWLDDVEPLVEVITTGIENTSLLTAAITFRINNSERKIPRFEVEDPEGLFFEKLQKGIEERLVSKVDDIDKYMKRIETECNLIVPNDLCSYFLILADIGDWCRSKNIMIGPGRGSVAGSLVAYCLHIHDVDPIPLGLYFERFLNESRVSAHHSYNITFEDGSKIKLNTGDKVILANGEECEVGKGFDPLKLNFKQGKVNSCKSSTFYTDLPDVDQDYPTYARDLVKDYIKDKYGHDYSCSVGTYTRAKLKTCIKDFAKAKGLPFDLTNKITKDIDDQIEYTWTDLFEYASKSKSLFKFVQQYPEIVHMTKYALLLCKAESIHPSAVIIVPKISQETGKSMNIYEWLPTKQIDGMLVSEWEGKYTESALFLKEDILGLNQLDKFQNMLRLIKQNTGKEIDVNKIPFNDEEVFRYFRKGWCEDVFQFGTNSLMNYCKQVKPTEFSDLAAMTALFRPGPIASNAHLEFAKIKNGKSKPKYDYGVKNITEETYSLLVYQEQMMSIIHQLGGLSLIEAEDARKYIKKKKHKELAALGDRFIAGAMKNGCPEDEAHKIWDKMNAFSSYSFNKSHAAAYTYMSYWSQWFKVNYPLEFWTTSLQYAKEDEIPFRLAELKKTGVTIEIRQPDVNYSGDNFTCDPENNRIFYSLGKIKGVGDIAVKHLVETRNTGGEFFSLEEFCSRVPSKVNKTVVKALIIAGAFDLLEGIEQPRDRRKLLQKYLIDIKGDNDIPEQYNTEEAKISNSFWTILQKESTGFGEIDYMSMLPNKRMKRLFVSAADFSMLRENSEAAVAGNLVAFTERDIKTGKMCNIQVSSSNEIIYCTLWPDAYEPILESIGGDMLDVKGKVICISGTVKKDKFRNHMTLYSDRSTKMYIIS